MKYDSFDTFVREVEAEMVRHGLPTLDAGHAGGMWDIMPNEIVLALADESPIEVARKILSGYHGPRLFPSDQ